MPFKQVKTGSAGFSTNTLTVTFDSEVSVDSVVVAFIDGNTGTDNITISDNKGNTYTRRVTSSQIKIYTLKVVTGGTDFQITAVTTVNNQIRRMEIVEYDQAGDYDTSTVGSGTSTTPSSGNIVPSEDGCIIYGAMHGDLDAVSITEGTDFALRASQVNIQSGSSGCEDLVQSSAAAIAATFTIGASIFWRCAVISITSAPAAGGTKLLFRI